MQFSFSRCSFCMPSPNFLQKNCNPPPRVIQKSYDPPHTKDMIGIVKQDQALPCSVHNRKRVALLPDLVLVATREELL